MQLSGVGERKSRVLEWLAWVELWRVQGEGETHHRRAPFNEQEMQFLKPNIGEFMHLSEFLALFVYYGQIFLGFFKTFLRGSRNTLM